MDSRELPRNAPDEGRLGDRTADSARPLRFPRLLTPPTVRRLSPGRMIGASVAGLAVLISIYYFGSVSWERSIRWLHQRPAYTVDFGSIVLDPPPPAWFPGGSEAFLKRFSHESNHEQFSALDVDLFQLTRKFRNDPLVSRVVQAEIVGPNRVVVRLEYRTPVAFPLFWSEAKDWYAIDEDGILIAAKDLDLEERFPPILRGDAVPLIWVKGLEPPVDPRAGKPWLRVSSSQSHGESIVDDRAEAVGRVARFLREQLNEDKEIRQAVDRFFIHISGEGKTWLQCGRSETSPILLWQNSKAAPLADRNAATLPDLEKWKQLHDWLVKNPPESRRGKLLLTFGTKELTASSNEADRSNGAR